MTRHRIEPWSPRPLANTLHIRPICFQCTVSVFPECAFDFLQIRILVHDEEFVRMNKRQLSCLSWQLYKTFLVIKQQITMRF